MITDAQCTLSDAQALTATANSTNVYDSLLAGNDFTAGKPMAVVLYCDVAADFTSANETYVFDVVASAATGLTSPTVIGTATILATALTLGSYHIVPIRPLSKILRYVGMIYTLGGTTPLLTVTAIIQPLEMIDQRKFYADAITI